MGGLQLSDEMQNDPPTTKHGKEWVFMFPLINGKLTDNEYFVR